MIARIIFPLILLVVLGSVQAQPLRLLKQGCVKQGDFLEEVPVYNYLDLIMVKVDIGGKQYDFMFDTGADVTIISEDIIAEMNLQPEKHCTIQDSKKRKKKTGLLAIPEMQIGGISFQSTAAAIENMDALNNLLSCYAIDGILGTNFIRLAYWQIDYVSNTIKLTNDPQKLTMSKDAIELVLHKGAIGAAKIDVSYNGVKEKLTFDTGSNGEIATTTKLLKKLRGKNTEFEFLKAHGDQSGGLYGVRNGNTWYGFVSNLNVDEFGMTDRIVKFESDAAKTIGNRFFKNFVVTIDWTGSRLYLDQVKKITCSPLNSYGFEFKPDYSNNGFKIGVVWDDYITTEKLPKLGSRVMKINGNDLSTLTREEFCTYLQKDINSSFDEDIELMVLEEGIPRTIKVTKTQILPK